MIRYESERVTIHHGDCIDVLRELPDASVDAVVTDPPYSLSFMSKDWDRHATPSEFQVWCEQWAAECLRVLKPGGHMLAFGGTRTWHRLACAIEDAGFEVRDNLAYMYGAGFPKSLDVSKAIDKAAGAERKVIGPARRVDGTPRNYEKWSSHQTDSMAGTLAVAGPRITAPATPDAARWQGWGTALKPAYEPIVLARKPLAGTVAANVLAYGTGALNVDACRVSHDARSAAWVEKWSGHTGHPKSEGWGMSETFGGSPAGRWPANVVLDETAAAMLDEQSGESVSRSGGVAGWQDKYVGGTYTPIEQTGHDDLGGASRFFKVVKEDRRMFYTAKAGSDERPRDGTTAHPTVKPLDLMRWLVRLVTPPGGTVLEPFAGSGTTVEACLLEGFRCVAVEREADYLPLILQRIHRRVDPVAHHAATRADDDAPSLFDLIGGDDAA